MPFWSVAQSRRPLNIPNLQVNIPKMFFLKTRWQHWKSKMFRKIKYKIHQNPTCKMNYRTHEDYEDCEGHLFVGRSQHWATCDMDHAVGHLFGHPLKAIARSIHRCALEGSWACRNCELKTVHQNRFIGWIPLEKPPAGWGRDVRECPTPHSGSQAQNAYVPPLECQDLFRNTSNHWTCLGCWIICLTDSKVKDARTTPKQMSLITLSLSLSSLSVCIYIYIYVCVCIHAVNCKHAVNEYYYWNK